jgi:hypothetical protein
MDRPRPGKWRRAKWATVTDNVDALCKQTVFW